MNAIWSFIGNLILKALGFFMIYRAGKKEAVHEATEKERDGLVKVVRISDRVDRTPDSDGLHDLLNNRP